MVTQQDNHNQAMLLINKLLGPNAAASASSPRPPHLVPGGPLPPPTGGFPPVPFTPPSFPPYYPPIAQAAPLIPHPPKMITPEKKAPDHERGKGSKSSKYSDSYKKKSHKRRYEEPRQPGKISAFDALIASHGTSSANRKPRESVNTDSQKVMGRQIRNILSQPGPKNRDIKMVDVDEKKERMRKRSKKLRNEKNYNDLDNLVPDDAVARKRRKIQEKVRSKRDSEIMAESKSESVYDYMHFDPDKAALKKKTEKILSNLIEGPKSSQKLDEIDATLKEIENENTEDAAPADEPMAQPEQPEPGEFVSPAPEKPAALMAPAETSHRVGIRGSLSRPPSPKPSELDIKKLLDDMEEGELSDDEEEYKKLINDVESTAPAETPAPAAAPSPAKMAVEMISPAKSPAISTTPTKSVEASLAMKLNLNTATAMDSSKPKSIPFLATEAKDQTVEKKPVSILDDLAFLTAIKTKYNAADQPVKEIPDPIESIEMKSKGLIEQLLRQDKISKEKEKQRRNKEKQREKDKKERDKIRQERRREKAEKREKLQKEVSELFSNFNEPASKTKSKVKSAIGVTNKLKKEFKTDFVKADQPLEGTLLKSTIDNSVLPDESREKVEEFVETNEHRFENGLVIQTSTNKVDETELYQKNKPVRYDFAKVNPEYPDFAVAGAIIYRLREKKQRLIHRVVNRIGKEKALDFLYRTEEVEENGGEMTLLGDRRKEPGGVYLGILKKNVDDDDIKYIFTVEEELASEAHLARKKQKVAKRKRYNNNKKENSLVNAMTDSLNLSGTENEAEEDAVINHIPETGTFLPFVPKPKKFELSFVKPAPSKDFITVGGDKTKSTDAVSKISAMMAGYSAFVKKGTSTSANIFKPSTTATMTAVPDLFDNLLREASDKRRTTSSEGMETEESAPAPVPVTGASGQVIGPHLIPARKPAPPTEEDNVERPALQNTGLSLSSWDTPSSKGEPDQASSPASEGSFAGARLNRLPELPGDRLSAILQSRESGELSEEGELSDSDEDMES